MDGIYWVLVGGLSFAVLGTVGVYVGDLYDNLRFRGYFDFMQWGGKDEDLKFDFTR